MQEDVTKQLRAEIASSYPLFLSHLTTSLALSDHLAPIRTSLSSLSSSMDRLHNKIHVPYEHLSTLVRRQQLLAQASDLSRRAARFVLVARRMEGQMARMNAAPAVKEGDGEKERELAKAALSVAELDALLHPALQDEDDKEERIPLDQLDFVKLYAPKVDTARDAIIQEMESMVINGLSDLNQPLLSSSLQTAHNLRLLPDLVSNLLADLNDAVTLRITRALDSAAIGKEVNGKGASSYRIYKTKLISRWRSHQVHSKESERDRADGSDNTPMGSSPVEQAREGHGRYRELLHQGMLYSRLTWECQLILTGVHARKGAQAQTRRHVRPRLFGRDHEDSR